MMKNIISNHFSSLGGIVADIQRFRCNGKMGLVMYTDVSKLYERRDLIDSYEGFLNKFLRSEEWITDATPNPPLSSERLKVAAKEVSDICPKRRKYFSTTY